MNKVHLIDCMEYMKDCKDNQFDLAIVDPPYGLERHKKPSLRIENNNHDYTHKTSIMNWDKKPSHDYFIELLRISKNAIIWGANNFTLPQTEYFIVWDKKQTVKNFASAEYAWTNIKQPAQVFRYSIHKEMQNRKSEGGKIHPTAKPIALYKWLLQNYAKPGQTIFDSHVGSGSIRIACHDLGFDFTGCELDKDYFEAQEARYQSHIAQSELFGKEEIQGLVFNK